MKMPWKYRRTLYDPLSYGIYDDRGEIIALVSLSPKHSPETNEEIVRLMCLAPELREALEIHEPDHQLFQRG